MQTIQVKSLINRTRAYEQIIKELRVLILNGRISTANAPLLGDALRELGKEIADLGQQINNAYALPPKRRTK